MTAHRVGLTAGASSRGEATTAGKRDDGHAGLPETLPAPGFEHIDAEKCRSFRHSMELVGKKWTAGVLLAGMRGARRFVEYRALIDGISDRLLAQRLKELEAHGLIERSVVPTTPVLVTYRPSERADALMRALHPLIAWSFQDAER